MLSPKPPASEDATPSAFTVTDLENEHRESAPKKKLVMWDHLQAPSAPGAGVASGASSSAAPSVRSTAPSDKPRVVLLNPPPFHGIPVVRIYRSEYLFVQGNNIPPVDLGYCAARLAGRADVLFMTSCSSTPTPRSSRSNRRSSASVRSVPT
jgi:hypothetical protein